MFDMDINDICCEYECQNFSAGFCEMFSTTCENFSCVPNLENICYSCKNYSIKGCSVLFELEKGEINK